MVLFLWPDRLAASDDHFDAEKEFEKELACLSDRTDVCHSDEEDFTLFSLPSVHGSVTG